MASGSVVATLARAVVRLAGFWTEGLEVSSVLRAGMVMSCNPRLISPCSLFDSTKSYLPPVRPSSALTCQAATALALGITSSFLPPKACKDERHGRSCKASASVAPAGDSPLGTPRIPSAEALGYFQERDPFESSQAMIGKKGSPLKADFSYSQSLGLTLRVDS